MVCPERSSKKLSFLLYLSRFYHEVEANFIFLEEDACPSLSFFISMVFSEFVTVVAKDRLTRVVETANKIRHG